MDDPSPPPPDLRSGDHLQSSRETSRALSETSKRSTRSTPITTPQAEKLSIKDESPVPQRSLRQRKSAASNGVISDPVEEAMKPLTDEERRNWKGWVELESDPVSIFEFFLSFLCTNGLSCKIFHIRGLIANVRLSSAIFYEHMVSKMSRFRRFLASMTIRYSTYCMLPPLCQYSPCSPFSKQASLWAYIPLQISR